MAKLALVALGVLVILTSLDPLVSRLMYSEFATNRRIEDTESDLAPFMLNRFREMLAAIGASDARTYEGWAAIPDVRGPTELRVFVIGNSAAIFSIAPTQVERRLAEAFPDREVSVTPLAFPATGVGEERTLARAALAKHADVVVFTPSLAGIGERDPQRVLRIRDLFALVGEGDAERSLIDRLRSVRYRHWLLYRSRDRLRELALNLATSAVPAWGSASRDLEVTRAALAAIAVVSRLGDGRLLVETYAARGLDGLIGTPVFHRRIPSDSPIFDQMRRNAREVTEAGALGVALFLPANPIFRNASVMGELPEYLVDDTYVRALAERTLGVYRDAGFYTADGLDALPPWAFLDLTHGNAEGIATFSEEAASIVIDAIAERGVAQRVEPAED